MIGQGSIRTRLTVTITVLTAALAVASVAFGLIALDDRVRQQAVDGRLVEAGDFSLGLFEDSDAELESDEIGFALAALAEVDLLDDLVDNLGDGDTLLVLLEDGEVAVVDVEPDRTPRVVRIIELGALAEDAVVIPSSDVLELALVTDELFDIPADLDELGELDGLDELDELDLETAADLDADVDRSLEFLIVNVDDVNLGLIVDLTDERAALAALRLPLWLAAAALTVLAGLATWLLTGRALRPVSAITSEVEAITAGTLHGRVPEPATDDEIGVLARTMNRMLGRLEDGDRQRRQFVSDASHELRTPVAVLRNEAEVAQRSPASTSVDQLAAVVLGESKRLEGLVEDLLTLARTDEDRATSAAEHGLVAHQAGFVEVDLDDLMLAEATRTRRLPVDRQAVSAGRILGRPDNLSRALAHLLDNAARHGRNQIAVGVQTDDTGTVTAWVDDDGAGIAEPDRARVFERFVRLDEARSRDQGGSGLGLAVVADVVAAHGGTVTVTDGPLGGARFYLCFPGPAAFVGSQT